MKTGLLNDSNDNEVLDILSIMTIFIEDASSIASIYTLHSKRKIISIKDINLALKARAFYGEKFWELPNISQRCQTIKRYLASEEEENEEEEEENEEEENEEEWKMSQCNCVVCNYMNTVEKEWEEWNPTSLENILIKKSIEKTFKDTEHYIVRNG